MPATTNETKVERPEANVLVTTRTFDGPPRLVFRAYTEPDLIRRWWAPRPLDVELHDCSADLRVGGRYRYVFGKRGSDHRMAFEGAYRELAAPDRLIMTQAFAPDAAGPVLPDEVLITITLVADGGKTRFTSHEVYPSAEVLDGILETGMETGMRMSLDQLDDLVRALG